MDTFPLRTPGPRRPLGPITGFTLTELLITMLLMGILSAIAIPNFIAWLPANRLNGAALQIMTDLQAARMRAVAENNEYKIFFPNNHTYRILDDTNGDGDEDVGETGRTKDIQIDYWDVTFNATANPVFTERGTATGTTVTVTNSAGSKTIRVASTGRVKID